jgi:hypothetical protein
VPITVSVGFWGAAGKHQVELVVESDNKKKTIHTKEIETKYLPELFELDIPVNLTINSPGIAFLEFVINKQVLARKALYFGLSDTIPKSGEEERFISEYQLRLTEEQRQCKDPTLVERNAEIEYFILCEKCVREKSDLKFFNEMKAVYWKSYPLPLRVYIASAIRMQKGKHSVKIELVNAATREYSIVTNTSIENTSDCLVTPIDGEMIVNIPKSGIYLFNLYVDDKFVTSSILPAELPQAKYSYSLLDDAQKQVESGELIILPRRSMLLDEIEKQ